ncbi:MAG: DUF4313 domain-containing protein [Bacteroidales bacterium]|nr:DUF4313 domain-containing protein [Bacteroidales bacterium]
MNKKKLTYKGKVVTISTDTYRNNGCLAIILTYKDGEREVITTNLNSPLQSATMAFLDTNNHPTIEKWIQDHGFGLPLGYSERSGFCDYPLYTIFIPAL